MTTKTSLVLGAFAALALAGAALAAPTPGEPVVAGPPGKTTAPAGAYSLDRNHSTVVFRLSHLGFSHYTAQFETVTGDLVFDPAHPAAMTVTASIDPKSLRLPFPPAGFKDELLGPHWLDAGTYPEIAFRSTKVDMTGPNTARVTGDFTLHGVTRPVVLETTFNGGYPPNSFDKGGRIGFSAHTVIRRSDFGVKNGIPAAGSNLGVGDQVEVTIETEWGGKPAG
ncbi:MAG: polyisoprenoid-binding protein [Phenylobacterium sp.]|nr:MAG: polyisoprenoid-binding protein [Phenylobacterium sp.]